MEVAVEGFGGEDWRLQWRAWIAVEDSGVGGERHRAVAWGEGGQQWVWRRGESNG